MNAPIAPRVAPAIFHLGGNFMISRYAKAAGDASGLVNPWAGYFAGRTGVLGDVDAEVLVATTFFFYPPAVHAAVAERRARGVSPAAGAERFRQACFAWGRARLDGFDGAGRLADLLEPVVDAADPLCAPIFAGWRALDRPDPGDDLARVVLATHLAREHRMAVHAVALRALGMGPLDAVLSGPGGAGNAAFFSWPEPYPDVSHLAGLRAEVEALTDTLAEPPYAAALSAPEADELVALLGAASAHALTTK